MLACSRQYWERHTLDEASLTHLSTQPFISQQRDAHALNNWFLHHFAKIPPALDIVLTVSSHQAVVNAIKVHLGLGIVVNHLVWDDLNSGRLVMLRSREEQAKNRISMVQLAGKIPPKRERLFINHLQTLAKSSKTLRRLHLTIDTP